MNSRTINQIVGGSTIRMILCINTHEVLWTDNLLLDISAQDIVLI